MPQIKWIGSPNFYPGRGGHKIIAIVNHIMCGSLAGTDEWFKNRSSQVSAHYGVGKDGTIHQYVRDEDTAWAVGQVNHPTWALFDQTGGHPNMCTISIEHEGQPEDGLTEAQYQATLWLHKQLIQKHGIPADSDHIIGHDKLDSVNRKDCPGPKFPWARLFKDLGVVQIVNLHVGSQGDDVKKVQHAINALGYTPQLDEDGDFGPNTEKAVRWFQSLKHIPVDGVVGPQTWALLFPAQVEQKPPAPEPKAPAEPPKAPATSPHHVLEINVDLETGKVISTKEVSE
jgi:N-acetylmuramoyl-L-alanine amidase